MTDEITDEVAESLADEFEKNPPDISRWKRRFVDLNAANERITQLEKTLYAVLMGRVWIGAEGTPCCPECSCPLDFDLSSAGGAKGHFKGCPLLRAFRPGDLDG